MMIAPRGYHHSRGGSRRKEGVQGEGEEEAGDQRKRGQKEISIKKLSISIH